MDVEFRKEHLPKWENLLHEIFDGDIPKRHEWKDKEEIISILNKLGKSDTLNHAFLASSGGMDIVQAKKSHEEGCIELHMEDLIVILRPEKLMFESFGEDNLEWAYFRLVLNDLKRTNTYDDTRYDYEILTELSPGVYEKRSVWDDGYYKGRELSDEARVVGRIMTGDIAIFNKASLYKANPDTYDGRHAGHGIEGFREHIEGIIEKLKNME